MHKPSILWPPPTDVESSDVRQSIRSRLRRATGFGDHERLKSFIGSKGRAPPPKDEPITPEQVVDAGSRMALGAFTPAPSIVEGQDQRVVLQLDSGETLDVDSQIQLYAPNNLLSHPLVSHCGAHLGGLPPLFFIAGDQEVLRDEIIYTSVFSDFSFFSCATHMCSSAHRAANPSKFPISAEVKRLYPRMAEIVAKYPTPTKVHLQVYDGCAHVLPILFAFTTPAKYCFRAVASFCRFATGMQVHGPGPSSPTSTNGRNFFGGTLFTSPPEEDGDLFTGSRGKSRRSWWGAESSSSVLRVPKIEKKSDKEKQRSDKEGKEKSKGDSQGEKDKVEKVEIVVEAKSEGAKEVSAEYPEPGKVEKGVTNLEAVGNGSPPVGEVCTVDKQPKADIVEKSETEDGTVGSLKDSRPVSPSRSAKGSQGSTQPGKKRWSLMIPRRSTPDQMPTPNRKLTEDVAGPRFDTVEEPRERCAGDYPSIYLDGFVSSVPYPFLYVS